MPIILTLDELKKVTTAYNGFSVVSECDIPDYYKGIFPHVCECGAEMIMTEPGHTQLQCCNPSCYVKMGHRLSYFISSLGYKGFGLQSSLALVSRARSMFKYDTFLSAFLLKDSEIEQCLSEHLAGVFCEIRDDIRNNCFVFDQAISALGIPNIGSRSTIFEVVKDPVVLIEYLVKGKLNEILDAAGISAPITRFYLNCFKVDLVTLMKDVMPNIINSPSVEIFVAITGKVSVDGKPYTRQEFISLCESIVDKNGANNYSLVETKAESKLDFVIADEPSSSSKYMLGLRLGKLITAQDFYEYLKKKASGEEIIDNVGQE